MNGEYLDPEFPEMEDLPEEPNEPEGNPEPEVFDEEFYEEQDIPDELREQECLELVDEYQPREDPQILNEDSEGALFLPDEDPIQQPLITEPLNPHVVYTKFVSKRLRHLTCERRMAEYNRPSGLYRPGN
jgi:hypothetical protein